MLISNITPNVKTIEFYKHKGTKNMEFYYFALGGNYGG